MIAVITPNAIKVRGLLNILYNSIRSSCMA